MTQATVRTRIKLNRGAAVKIADASGKVIDATVDYDYTSAEDCYWLTASSGDRYVKHRDEIFK